MQSGFSICVWLQSSCSSISSSFSVIEKSVGITCLCVDLLGAPGGGVGCAVCCGGVRISVLLGAKPWLSLESWFASGFFLDTVMLSLAFLDVAGPVEGPGSGVFSVLVVLEVVVSDVFFAGMFRRSASARPAGGVAVFCFLSL